ncbi:MAG TPA: hypothetical protein VGZ49_05415 [Xanthobacteraceae bacterium]|jgi:hypothetical protein|nr:hypothetical protein [Xanthobacteraceae bacterium]
MFTHEMSEYIPASVGVGAKTKVTIQKIPDNPTAVFQKGRADISGDERVRDRWFLATLLAIYGGSAFPRGNLDAGRINRLFGREIVPASTHRFDATSLESELRINIDTALSFLRLAC